MPKASQDIPTGNPNGNPTGIAIEQNGTDQERNGTDRINLKPHTQSDPPLRVVESLDQKFRMHDDWQPHPETLRMVLATASFVTAEMITADVIGEFKNHWIPEQAQYAERQWVNKLCQRIAARIQNKPVGGSSHAANQRFTAKPPLDLDDTSWGDNLDAALDIG